MSGDGRWVPLARAAEFLGVSLGALLNDLTGVAVLVISAPADQDCARRPRVTRLPGPQDVWHVVPSGTTLAVQVSHLWHADLEAWAAEEVTRLLRARRACRKCGLPEQETKDGEFVCAECGSWIWRAWRTAP